MVAFDPASLRALRWRVHGLPARIGQTLLIGGLVWLQTRSPLALIWIAAAGLSALVDTEISRRLLARLDDWRLGAWNMLSRVISSVAFSSVCFVMLVDRSGFGLAGAVLLACAINLNNAVMTRGSRVFALSLVTPSSFCLVALPFAALAVGQPLSPMGAVLMTVGTAGYTIFIVLLAAQLFRENLAMAAALEAAEAASHAKSSFLAVTSHEIRTPLNGVLGMAQAMEHDALSPVQRERIGVIRQSGEALLELLNDILDLAKIEAGKLELATAPFDLEAVTRNAMGAFSATAMDKGLSYSLDFDPAACGAWEGDAARVRQVLCNLISNAVKFTETGEVAISVTAQPAGVRLSVRDSGPGVPQDFAERLFEKFTQADASNTRRFGGTGLGLAICRELCASMGGAISAANDPRCGAVFTVDLPLARAVLDAAAPAPTLQPLAAGETPLRVLAAEDNSVNRLVLRTLLEQVGAVPTLVDNGAQALKAWEDGEFDLILMDIQMPQMDGPTAARAIRAAEAQSGRPRTPIVALTANVMSHQVEAYAAAGMDAFVAKPIVVADLYAAISGWARRTEAAAEAA